MASGASAAGASSAAAGVHSAAVHAAVQAANHVAHTGTPRPQPFCGDSPDSWGPFVDGHLSPCFVHIFLGAPLILIFVISATVRLRQIVCLPVPAPRPLTRYQVFFLGMCSAIAAYNLILFAVHSSFGEAQPYQWILYPVGCLTWLYCVLLLLAEAKYGLPTNWVLRAFWVASLIVGLIQLGANASSPHVYDSPFFTAFLIHQGLLIAIGGAALTLKENHTSYSQLPLDFSEITFDEDNNMREERGLSDVTADGHPGKRGAPGEPFKYPSIAAERLPSRRLAMLFGEDKGLVAAGLICCVVGAPIEVIQFIYIGLIIDEVAIPEAPHAFSEYVGVLVLLYIVEAISAGAQLVLFMIVGERMSARLRKNVFSAALRQELGFFDGSKVTDIVARIRDDVARVQEAQTVQLSLWLQGMIQIFVGTAFLFVLSWKLSLVALAIIPFVALMMLAQATVMQSFTKRTMDWLARVESLAHEVLSNLRTVRSFARENREKARFGQEVLEANRMAKRMAVAHGTSEGLGVFVLKMCAVLGLFYGGTLVHHHDLSGGVLVSFVFIALQVVMAFSVIPPLVGQMSQSVAAATRIFNILDREPAINVRGGLTLPTIEGRLEFRNVKFAFPSRPDQPALQSFNLRIEARQTVAICGPPGSGKSSVVLLVERLFDPQEGLVLLDDTDISTFDPVWLRQQIGVVAQDPVIFASHTIADNIAYGQDATTQSIEQAAETVGMHRAISSLAQGYKTLPPDAGLDMGQRQRLAVARALLKNPKVLLLDEATTGLDPESEVLVQNALSRAAQGRTVVIVAHRVAAARNADTIAVMKKGRVVESGDHLELMSRPNGSYRIMWERQMPPEESADLEEEAELGGGVSSGARHEPPAAEGSRALQLVDELEREILRVRPGHGTHGGITGDALQALQRGLADLRDLASAPH